MTRPGTPSDREVERAVRAALAEDRFRDDRTTRALGIGATSLEARVVAQAAGVLSGMRAARAAARACGLMVVRAAPDGTRVRPGYEVLRLRGPAAGILAGERTILNYLMHLSGVASATDRAVRAARRARPPLEVWGTRKTLPGLRDLEKAAIEDGGGKAHRRDLADAYLVKGNHLALRPLPEALRRLARARRPGRRIEVEVGSARDALAAARAGVDALLIDNRSPAAARRIIEALRAAGLRRRVFVELSGGITPERVARYRTTGADAVSLGALTHSAKALPFHLRLVRRRPASR